MWSNSTIFTILNKPTATQNTCNKSAMPIVVICKLFAIKKIFKVNYSIYSAKKIKNSDEIKQVATVSANWDDSIGSIIAEAMGKVGKDGTITVEEAKTIETTLDVVEGMQFDKGYLSPYFCTNAESLECVLDDPYILLFEKKISSMKDLLPLLEKTRANGDKSFRA